MKKIFVFICFVLFSTFTFAQRFDAGLIGGFNASQVDGDLYRGYHKPGIVLGAYVQTDIAPAIFGSMEIKYSQKGSRNQYDEDKPEENKYIMRLGYIDIPVILGFRTSDKIMVIAGASAGYLLHGKEFDEYGEFLEPDQNAFEDFDVQAIAGFQFDLLDNIKLDLRMCYSLLPIRGLPGSTNYYWNDNQFNNVISLAVHYRFDR